MSDVTRILSKLDSGDPLAADELLPLVYEELRRLAAVRLAAEPSGNTLQATGLVHEAYVRLVGADNGSCWDHRGHFFAAAAEAMRRILVDRARHKQALKRGGGQHKVEVPIDMLMDSNTSPAETLAIHEILDHLAAVAPRKAELVKLRYFLGCTMAEAAGVLGIATATAEDDWTYARAWLRREFLRGEENSADS